MAYQIDPNTGEIVFNGFDQGIAASPYKGIANMQNVNISTEQSEVMCSFNRLVNSPVGGSGTLTQTSSSTVSFSGVTPPAGSWIKILVDSGTGLSGNYYYPGSGNLATKYITSTSFSRNSVNANLLAVGSGGGGGTGVGGTNSGGGGGGGQVFPVNNAVLTVTSYPITVGTSPSAGVNGNSTSIGSFITATGGNAGTSSTSSPSASGNGGNSGNGFTGGTGVGTGHAAGGGGAGANANGSNGTSSPNVGGNGGNGLANSISGSSVTYGGGGGGGSDGGSGVPAGGTGGTGGGGNGNVSSNGSAGTANTGGGGGNGAAGGSGIAIISVPTGSITATGGTKTTVGGNDIYTFTSSGTFTVSSISSISNIVTNINSGFATFSVYTVNSPVQSASETYTASNGTTQYRYYILDKLGQVWINDSFLSLGWFLSEIPSQSFSLASGLNVLNGWLSISLDNLIYWKSTSNLGANFTQSLALLTKTFHSTLVGHQGKMYWTDGNFIASLFPNTSLLSGAANIQSTASYTGSGVNGTISTLIGGTLPTTGILSGARIPIYFFTDGNLPNSITAGNVYYIQITSLTYPVTFNVYDSATSYGIFSLTGNPAAGQTTGILTATWTNPTATIYTLFPDGEKREVLYTNGSTSVSWSPGLTATQSSATITVGTDFDIQTGAYGDQYFSTFYPFGSGGAETYTFSPERLNLPYFENATCMAELGNTVLVGGIGSVIYPWDQVQALPSDLIYLPENYTYNLLTVENVTYAFVGNKGNIYVTSGASASAVISVPDYCAGIPGNPSSYYEPYFIWGGTMYLRSRLYFSIQDQTSAKTGNCGGIWSFIPTQSTFINQDVGASLRLENKSSYGTYNGMCPVLLPNFNQQAIAPQYYSGWYSSISSPSFGIDTTGTTTGITSLIETDLVPTGTMLSKKTFKQIEYKVSSPLQSGETITLMYRQNSTDAYSSTNALVSDNALSGYFPVNFEAGQWVQLQATLTPLATSSSSFCRLIELRLR